MDEFRDRTAVITGAASGIGRALALRCADEAMSVVIADVDEDGLEQTRQLARSRGANVIACKTDVSKVEEVEALASSATDAFSKIHLVFNNAGVLLSGCAWERSHEDWEWVLGVNVWGVINGARVFMPRLLEHGEPAHMVNTASIGGLLVGPFLAPYIVSKHAVVALTESIYYELAEKSANVSVSALCPGAVATGITSSERIRPEQLGDAAPLESEVEKVFQKGLLAGIGAGIQPDEIAGHVFDAIREKRFWILPDPSYKAGLEARTDSIIQGVNPIHRDLGDVMPKSE